MWPHFRRSNSAFGTSAAVIALFIHASVLRRKRRHGKTFIGLDPLFGLDPAAREGTRSSALSPPSVHRVHDPCFPLVREPKIRAVRQDRRASLAGLCNPSWTSGKEKAMRPILIGSMFYRDSLNAVYGLGARTPPT